MRYSLTRIRTGSDLSGAFCYEGRGKITLGASVLCFVTWNFAVKELGAVKTSVYIYMVPVITVVASALILYEPLTLLAGTGTILTLIGLFLSEHKAERTGVENGFAK